MANAKQRAKTEVNPCNSIVLPYDFIPLLSHHFNYFLVFIFIIALCITHSIQFLQNKIPAHIYKFSEFNYLADFEKLTWIWKANLTLELYNHEVNKERVIENKEKIKAISVDGQLKITKVENNANNDVFYILRTYPDECRFKAEKTFVGLTL